MTDIQFGRLQDLPLRDAWRHEALEFTPWLAENIDHLSEAIGMPLELTGTEVAVDRFAADILARNGDDQSVVLIENQLEEGDHRHLGQIMTYLAGLSAQTVVWIAPKFLEAHRAAIEWLNENTTDDFSFFAVTLRVVRIGDSPFAPIFEVIEQPNQWSRSLKRKADNAQSAAAEKRVGFWQLYIDRHADAGQQGIRATGASNHTLQILPGQLVLGRYVSRDTCGIYLRGPNGQEIEKVASLLEPYRDAIETELGAKFREGDWHAISFTSHSLENPESWPHAVDFLHEQTQEYLTVLRRIFPEAN